MSTMRPVLSERDVGADLVDLTVADNLEGNVGVSTTLAREANSGTDSLGVRLSDAESTAHQAAMKSSIQEVATELNSLFGRELVAIMTRVQSPRTVTQWIRGESEPHPGTAKALRNVFYVAAFLLASGQARETVQAWFVGMNPHLKGESPAEVIGQDSLRVLEAAKAFIQYP